MRKLLVILFSLLVSTLAVSAPLNVENNRQSLLDNAGRVGACIAVFSATHEMTRINLLAMQASKLRTNPETIAELNTLANTMNSNVVLFNEWFKTVLALRAKSANVSYSQLNDSLLSAYSIQRAKFASHIASLNQLPLDYRAAIDFAYGLSPAVRGCVIWYRDEINSKFI